MRKNFRDRPTAEDVHTEKSKMTLVRKPWFEVFKMNVVRIAKNTNVLKDNTR